MHHSAAMPLHSRHYNREEVDGSLRPRSHLQRADFYKPLDFTSFSAVSQFVSVCALSHLLEAVVFRLSILLRRDRPQACMYDQSWDTNIPDVRHDAAITDKLPMRRR